MDDAEALAALRAGDEAAFRMLVTRYGPAMRRVIRTYLRDQSVADEVLQESWLGFVQSLDRFEGRSSLKTWLLRIAAHQASKRAVRERRSVPFSALEREGEEDPGRFLPEDHPRWPGHWAAMPADWSVLPEDAVVSREARTAVLRAIRDLPERQRDAIVLRDVEGVPSDEAAAVLGVSEGNLRVLLHRARTRVRESLAGVLEA